MPFSIDNSPQLSLDACLVATTRCVLTIAVPLTLDPLTRVRLSEVGSPILGLHGAARVLLFMVAHFEPPLLILSEHRQPQSQRRVHKQPPRHRTPQFHPHLNPPPSKGRARRGGRVTGGVFMAPSTKYGEQEVKVSKKLCRTDFAGETDAEQVLSTLAYGLRPRSHILTLSAPRSAAASEESRPKYPT
jgi:hypothetical protein